MPNHYEQPSDTENADMAELPASILGTGVLPFKKVNSWLDKKCGGCTYFNPISAEEKLRVTGGNLAAPKLGDCLLNPPTPVIIVGEGRPTVSVMYPRITETYQACSRFAVTT